MEVNVILSVMWLASAAKKNYKRKEKKKIQKRNVYAFLNKQCHAIKKRHIKFLFQGWITKQKKGKKGMY